MNQKLKKFLRSITNTLLVGLFILSTLIVVRTYFYDIYYIPSNSMENTLLPGDVILVKKYSKKQKNFCYAADSSLQFPVQRQDVIVFKFPNNPKLNFVKRCCALPGDSILIKESRIIVNGTPEPENKNRMFRCRFTSHTDPGEKLDSLNFKYSSHFRGKNQAFHWYYVCDGFNFDKLKNSGLFEHLIIVNQAAKSGKELYPKGSGLSNSRDNWGPVTVPYKGMTLKADSINIKWYSTLINKFENHKLSIQNNQLLVDGTIQDHYVIQKNYFLMIGDNRHGSTDSRYWGFVPEDHLIGKATCVLASKGESSKETNNIRVERFFKTID